ncbi:hypothetical protein FN846DRAFT_979899 [Sphaerosporella brunnea]|uniref:Uncharacterized protein n=1 Tax=Sphaerosporella brunnea TaxID=1250544 RepID=A0A5J5EET6_9PEZI|nr:hypothetical protein FN846DRAFT_979899 [Sphaerosporella brunnea]
MDPPTPSQFLALPNEVHLEISAHIVTPQCYTQVRLILAVWTAYRTHPWVAMLYLSELQLQHIYILLKSYPTMRLRPVVLQLLYASLDHIHGAKVWPVANKALVTPMEFYMDVLDLPRLRPLLPRAAGRDLKSIVAYAFDAGYEQVVTEFLERCEVAELRECLPSALTAGIRAFRTRGWGDLYRCLEMLVDAFVDDPEWTTVTPSVLEEVSAYWPPTSPDKRGGVKGELQAAKRQRHTLQLLLRIPCVITGIECGSLFEPQFWEMLPVPLLKEVLGKVHLSSDAKRAVLEAAMEFEDASNVEFLRQSLDWRAVAER